MKITCDGDRVLFVKKNPEHDLPILIDYANTEKQKSWHFRSYKNCEA